MIQLEMMKTMTSDLLHDINISKPTDTFVLLSVCVWGGGGEGLCVCVFVFDSVCMYV
jgi:hypothetical protein